MNAFHGSTQIIRQPLANAGRPNLDFVDAEEVTPPTTGVGKEVER